MCTVETIGCNVGLRDLSGVQQSTNRLMSSLQVTWAGWEHSWEVAALGALISLAPWGRGEALRWQTLRQPMPHSSRSLM